MWFPHRAFAFAFALLFSGSVAQADDAAPVAQPEHAASIVLIVEDDGSAFDVPVHPDIVTVVYLPDPIQKVMRSDEQRFPAQIMGKSVVVRPPTDVPADARGNLSIITDTLKVSVMLRIAASPEQAVAQASFKTRAEVERFDRAVIQEVERRYRIAKVHFEARHHALDREVLRKTEKVIADRLLRHHETKKIGRRARHDDNVIVHVQRGVWVGPELYLFFEIQNRDRQAYRFAELRITGYDRKNQRAGIVRFRSSAYPDENTIGVVPAGERGHGIVCVRDADRIAGEPVTLVVSEHEGKRAIKVEGIRW